MDIVHCTILIIFALQRPLKAMPICPSRQICQSKTNMRCPHACKCTVFGTIICKKMNLHQIPVTEILPKARILNMANNNIRDVNYTRLMMLPDLTWLTLDTNLVSAFNASDHSFPNLIWLDLSNNNITSLKMSHENYPNLEILHLDGNPLTDLYVPASINLLILHLSNTHMTNFPGPHQIPSSIKELHLNNNPIESLDVQQFYNLTQLQLINVEITAFPLHTFKLPKSLEEVDLSYNPLQAILISESEFPRLKKLNLLNTSLTFVSIQSKSLTRLHVKPTHHNAIRCVLHEQISARNLPERYMIDYEKAMGSISSREGWQKCDCCSIKESCCAVRLLKSYASRGKLGVLTPFTSALRNLTSCVQWRQFNESFENLLSFELGCEKYDEKACTESISHPCSGR